MIRFPRAGAAIAVLLWFVGFGVPTTLAAEAAPDPMIPKVERGLSRPVQIAGEPSEVWSLAERVAFYKVPGVSIAVIKDGRIAWAKGYGVLEAGKPAMVDADTIFQAASISKPVAAAAALRLVEQDELSLDAPINAALKSWKIPDNEYTAKAPVTLRQILRHRAGLTVHGFPGYAAGAPVPTLPQILDGAPPANTAAVRVDKLPGASMRYSGGGYTVMQLAMEDASGRDFPWLTETLIFRPVGMTRSSYVNPLPPASRTNAATAHLRDGAPVAGHSHTYPEMAAAGLWTTPSDLTRFALAIVGSARGDRRALLGQLMGGAMLTPYAGPYGHGLEIANPGDGPVFAHGGSNHGFEAFLFAYADGHGGAAIMTNGSNGARLAQEIRASLASAYGWRFGAPVQRAALALTPQRAAEFSGDYVVKRPGQPDLVVAVTAEDAKLWIQAMPFIEKQRLYVASDTQVFTLASPMLGFRVDPDGRPQAIEVNRGVFAERKK